MAMSFEFSDEMLATFVPIVAFWVFSGIYEVLMYLLPDSRLHPKEEEEEKNIASRWTVLKAVLAQQAVQILLVFLIMKITGTERGIPKPQPSLPVMAVQMFTAMAFLDAWQYAAHRCMHSNRFLYKHIHSVHHELLVPYSYGGLYSHPLDGLVSDTVGGILAAVVSGMTARTSMYFFSLASVRGVDLHCGLWLPWSPFQMIFANSPAFHDTHHQLRGFQCNFAQPFFLAWDKLLGTYVPFSVEKRKNGGYEVRILKD